ncbi:MAG: ABC transporter permease, partial [Acidobacteriaceae bacterium]|nr:ABC transporter permease [Acidobacteriaceae bacterium]
MVAIRGLARSLYSSLGFEARNATIVDLSLAMAGYSNDQAPALQKRILDSLRTIPGVESVGLSSSYPPLIYAAAVRENVFRNQTNDLTVANVAVRPYRYDISPGYFEAAKTSLLAGRDFTWHDDKNALAVAVVNRHFAVTLFGSVNAALGGFYKLQDGTRVQVVGIVEDGKYMSLTEDQQPAIFLPFLRSPTSQCALVIRSSRDPQQLAGAIRSNIRELEAGLPVDTQSWSAMLNVVLFPSRVATVSLGVLGIMGAMLSVTGVFGMAAYAVSRRLKELGIRLALGAQPRQLLQAALGRAFRLLAWGSFTGLLLGIAASRILSAIVYQATPRDPLVLSGVVLTMLLLGLFATWIPAQRVLSINPLKLLREE